MEPVEVLGRKRVGRVLHRVRGHDRAVVAVRVRGREIALERHGDRQVAQRVRGRVPTDPDDADGGLAVAVRGELDHAVSLLGQLGMPVDGDVDDRVERAMELVRRGPRRARRPSRGAAPRAAGPRRTRSSGTRSGPRRRR